MEGTNFDFEGYGEEQLDNKLNLPRSFSLPTQHNTTHPNPTQPT